MSSASEVSSPTKLDNTGEANFSSSFSDRETVPSKSCDRKIILVSED